ncbi:multifunctional 2',3'-cyclic-nucleotide 2'-phosphodiesterase/5'-nucleotidase/3'-nucleotidase [Vibrio sp. MACH09]|uniref:bifunctional metallophosphatase/5'-nucleotidase n=1 Tax=Vibrio sp. MACH09 TaxID=3025122 RepID=UPI0027903724|nr:5'-nucleotidase C-terminal domain-containing protein [Vibrio sp. MACH09]GLO63501.1 multifunctional 2',3'-cyclic-nucleotide 2'-phosphodiesterase/5'-nucleotidase/3'-nucleotidase [Vibrio sp. MACH09]
MNKTLLHIIVGIFIGFMFSFKTIAETELNIIYVSKTVEVDSRESKVGGLANLQSLVKATRQANKNTLFLHGGDFLAGSLMSSFDRGTHMIDLLNMMEPDAVAINEREFAFKEDELSLRIQESAFPYININITDPLTGGRFESTEESMCFELKDIKACVFSILDPLVIENYPPDRISVDPSLDLIEDKARSLREQGADLVILMASNEEDQLKNLIEKELVDMLLYSNSHQDSVLPVGNGLLVSQGTEDGKAALIKVKFDNRKRAEFGAELISLNNFEPDPEFSNKINYYLSALDGIMNTPVGKVTSKITSRREKVRSEEVAFGNLVADALREYYNADIALVNGGSIRGNKEYAAGAELTRKDIQSELPFDPPSVLFQASGQDILAALENGLSLVEQVKGRFLQVSGMKFSWCPDSPVGQRVGSVTIGGQPIALDKQYTIATSEYLARGGDGFVMFKGKQPLNSKKVSLIMWELVRAYISERGEVSPKVEGRISQICST